MSSRKHLDDKTIAQLSQAPSDEPWPEEHEDHLSRCAQCRQEVRLDRRVTQALSAVPHLVAPPALLQGVMEAVAAARAERRRWFASSVAMASAGLCLVVFWLLSGGASTLALEAVDLLRAVELAAQVASALWHAFPVHIVVMAGVVLLGSTALVGRAILRVGGPALQEEAG